MIIFIKIEVKIINYKIILKLYLFFYYLFLIIYNIILLFYFNFNK